MRELSRFLRAYLTHVALYGGSPLILAFLLGADEAIRRWAQANTLLAILLLLSRAQLAIAKARLGRAEEHAASLGLLDEA